MQGILKHVVTAVCLLTAAAAHAQPAATAFDAAAVTRQFRDELDAMGLETREVPGIGDGEPGVEVTLSARRTAWSAGEAENQPSGEVDDRHMEHSDANVRLHARLTLLAGSSMRPEAGFASDWSHTVGVEAIESSGTGLVGRP
jgi:hypothetical protein